MQRPNVDKSHDIDTLFDMYDAESMKSKSSSKAKGESTNFDEIQIKIEEDPFKEIKSIDEKTAKLLKENGIKSIETLNSKTIKDLTKIRGIRKKLAQEINANNFNSCEMAETLVGGMWPRTKATQQHICKDLGNYSGKFADWAEARQKCSDAGKYNETMNKAKEAGSQQYEKSVIVNNNLIWGALNKSGYLKDDPILRQFFMSLS